MEIWESKLPGTLWATPGLLRESFTFYLFTTLSDLYKVLSVRKELNYFGDLFVTTISTKFIRNMFSDFGAT